jgi:DNA-binding response OmpR family regulator
VITDIEMPKLDGIGLIKKIYKTNPAQKIIVVSAYSDKSYLIPLLNIGIEGFLQKPVTSDHIANMLIDFCDGMQNSDIVIDDEYKYNKHSKELTKNNKSVELSSNEIKLLELFLDSPNRYFTLIDIFNHIFYDDPFKDYSQDSIRALLKRLRKKLPQDIIINSRTLGYTIKI